MDLSGNLSKQVGDSKTTVGDIAIRFLFGAASVPSMSWLDKAESGSYAFQYPIPNPSLPGTGENNRLNRSDSGEWTTLEKLPEGTVAEVYVSFDRLFTTDEMLAWFEHKNMQPVWFAVDAGPKSRHEASGSVPYPIGFPYWPIWHADDLKKEVYEEKKTGLFSKVVTSGGSYPSVAAYGDGEKRNDNFMKTLSLLQTYPSIVQKTAPFTDIAGAADYIGANGIKLYGGVITGPVKELLKLREETWIRNIRLGEMRLWNWRDR